MQEYLSISKQNPQFPAYLDFPALRQIGIKYLQQLSGQLWTDYNLHDPGVTILEVLCYAVTELGYRNNLDIEDLLALKPGVAENNFFTPDQILTCNPITILDIRKRLIDIEGVHNAWLEKVTDYDPPIWIDTKNNTLRSQPPSDQSKLPRLHPRGLYTVYLDLDPDYHKNACGDLCRSWSDTLDEVKAVLCRYRNLCEDIYDIIILDEEEIRLCADIELAMDADGEDVLVAIYGQIQDFLVPQIQFYTLQQLLDKNVSPADIFAGRPARDEKNYQSHGFIDTVELDQLTLPTILHTSDFYQTILDIPGVAAIKNLLIASSINGIERSQESPWYLHLTPHYRPVLSLEFSKIRLFKNGLPNRVNLEEVKRRYYEQRSTRIKMKRTPYELDLTVPKGRYTDTLANHYSIHHDFPLTYGISEEGLPEPITPRREAQVKQLKGYLVFFDQLLANYLAQLAHVRELFSWNDPQTTYFNQAISFPGSAGILSNNYLSAIATPTDTDRDRRDRLLDHLLARFAESFTDYALFNYKVFERHADQLKHEEQLMQEKARFVQDYPQLSRDRCRAADCYNSQAVWDTDTNISGFKQRVSRLLGINKVHRKNLNSYQVEPDQAGYTIALGDLTSQQVYPSEAAAQAEIGKFLAFALCTNYYQRLTYRYYYHYGFEVEIEQDGSPIQARHLMPFFSREARDIALEQWINTVATQPPEKEIIENDDRYYFQFKLGTEVRFVGVQRYFSRETVEQQADALLAQLGQSQNYRAILFHVPPIANPDPLPKAERESTTPSSNTLFTHYGYALVDSAGSVLAESHDRFASSLEREDALYRFWSTIRAGEFKQRRPIASSPFPQTSNIPPERQLEFDGELDQGNYRFVLRDRSGTILRSQKSYAKSMVWQNAYQFADHLFYLARYISLGETVAITDSNGNVLAIALTERDPLTLFKQLNGVDPFLFEQPLPVESGTELVTRYRCQLRDRTGDILLEATQLFETEAVARDRFYQEVLGVLFEPGLRYSRQTLKGFEFGILNRAGKTVATHPTLYTSEQERDAAVNRLFLLIRTARLSFTTQQAYSQAYSAAYIGRIVQRNGTPLLQGMKRYLQPEQAWQAGNALVELIATESDEHFRLIDSDEDCGVYGWELTNPTKDDSLATQFYPSECDRNSAIATLRQQVNQEGFHVLEHILLRPRHSSLNESVERLLPIDVDPETVQSEFTIVRRDPYSFWISIVLPYWPERFRDFNFRRFVERTLRLEAPAHVALKIAWVNVQQMDQFETAYREWLEQLAQTAAEGMACDLVGAQNRLVERLTQLRSVYPKGNLSGAQASALSRNPIVLNQTILGSTQGDTR